MIIKSDYRIASATDGYGLLLRNKHLTDAEHRLPDNSVLFVHGATYGASMTYDYPIEEISWMDVMAAEGFDVWCIDLLGYGLSDRPSEMDEEPASNPPLVDTADAMKELDRVVDYICTDRKTPSVSLIGYSWGSAICGAYAGSCPDKINRLVLSGALWVGQDTKPRGIVASPGAYRTVDVDAMMKRWAIGLSDDEIDSMVPRSVRRAWCEAVVATDPRSAVTAKLRAPAGVVKDYSHCARTGEAWYDPAAIRCPVQIVVGELDRETTPEQGRQVFDRLTGTEDRRYTIIGGGTHSLLLENRRQVLFDVVSGFLR